MRTAQYHQHGHIVWSRWLDY